MINQLDGSKKYFYLFEESSDNLRGRQEAHEKMLGEFSIYIIKLNNCGSFTKYNYDLFSRHIIVIAHCSLLGESMKKMSSYWKL